VSMIPKTVVVEWFQDQVGLKVKLNKEQHNKFIRQYTTECGDDSTVAEFEDFLREFAADNDIVVKA